MIARPQVWKLSPTLIALSLAALLLLVLVFRNGLSYMLYLWTNRPEHSHGFLLPLVAAFLLWQKWDRLERLPFSGSWLGFAVATVGVGLMLVGELSALHVVTQGAFVLALAGLILALLGRQAFATVWFAITVLILMVPLPNFLMENLSAKLQLISSAIGVAFIRLFGISVYLEGNVIDLGAMQLQVVEACDGLRYLFPLLTLAVVCAYFYRASFWKRAIVVLSSIPITIFINSLRIATIGVALNHGSRALAEGLLHDFQGGVMFLICAALLLGEMWLLSRITGERRPFRDVFGFSPPAATPRDAAVLTRELPRPFIATVGLLAVTTLAGFVMPSRTEQIPERQTFAMFPNNLGIWNGHFGNLADIYLQDLKVTDYIFADYLESGTNHRVNLYIAYYASQRAARSAHSPRSCLPGGGWRLTDSREIEIDGNGPRKLKANRVLIQLGDDRQLVYYWFQQRGRAITNEYKVKWYLLQDALAMNRTDGALVRLVAPIPKHASENEIDAAMQRFLSAFLPNLNAYVPN